MSDKNLLKRVACLQKRYEQAEKQDDLAAIKLDKAEKELISSLKKLQKLILRKTRILIKLYKLDNFSAYDDNDGWRTLEVIQKKSIDLKNYYSGLYGYQILTGEQDFFKSFPVEWLFKSDDDVKNIILTKNKKSLESLNQKLKKVKAISKAQTILELKAEIVRLGGNI